MNPVASAVWGGFEVDIHGRKMSARDACAYGVLRQFDHKGGRE